MQQQIFSWGDSQVNKLIFSYIKMTYLNLTVIISNMERWEAWSCNILLVFESAYLQSSRSQSSFIGFNSSFHLVKSCFYLLLSLVHLPQALICDIFCHQCLLISSEASFLLILPHFCNFVMNFKTFLHFNFLNVRIIRLCDSYFSNK